MGGDVQKKKGGGGLQSHKYPPKLSVGCTRRAFLVIAASVAPPLLIIISLSVFLSALIFIFRRLLSGERTFSFLYVMLITSQCQASTSLPAA